MKRFYFISGKGGVGKTTYAMALTKYLKDQNKKVLYLNFDTNHYDEQTLNELKIPYEKITIYDSSLDYISRKIKSKMIAKTIIKTPFYKAISNIVPGFNNIILLGKIRELLKDPELIIVLDAPATGHALTTLESLTTFKKIFNQGMVLKDIEKIALEVFADENYEILVISTPEKLVDSESQEFINGLKERNFHSQKIINKVLSISNEVVTDDNLPEIIKKKINLEKEFLANLKNENTWCPFYFEDSVSNKVLTMSKNLSLKENHG